MLKTKYLLLFVLTILCEGCAQLATSVATQAGVQYAGERYLIAHKSPVIKCNLYNVIQGNKMCRVSKTYLIRRV